MCAGKTPENFLPGLSLLKDKENVGVCPLHLVCGYCRIPGYKNHGPFSRAGTSKTWLAKNQPGKRYKNCKLGEYFIIIKKRF